MVKLNITIAYVNSTCINTLNDYCISNNLPFRRSFGYVRCINHTINLSVTSKAKFIVDFLSKFENELECMKKMINKVRRVREIREVFNNYQRVLSQREIPLELIKYNETRWTSIFESVNRLLLLKPEVSLLNTYLLSNNIVKDYTGIDVEIWELLIDIHELLGGFYYSSIYLQSEKYPTLSHTISTYHNLYNLSINYKYHGNEKYRTQFEEGLLRMSNCLTEYFNEGCLFSFGGKNSLYISNVF